MSLTPSCIVKALCKAVVSILGCPFTEAAVTPLEVAEVSATEVIELEIVVEDAAELATVVEGLRSAAADTAVVIVEDSDGTLEDIAATAETDEVVAVVAAAAAAATDDIDPDVDDVTVTASVVLETTVVDNVVADTVDAAIAAGAFDIAPTAGKATKFPKALVSHKQEQEHCPLDATEAAVDAAAPIPAAAEIAPGSDPDEETAPARSPDAVTAVAVAAVADVIATTPAVMVTCYH